MAREQLDWQINSGQTDLHRIRCSYYLILQELNIGGEGEVKQEVERRKRGYGSRFLVALGS
uniref:Uncharacterized protein n=1 Tax=Oryza nivara TaxID=4536 RepID=A0A679BB72_ORYNI|nr:hypothetical protein [Oryza sativa f. spontanea]